MSHMQRFGAALIVLMATIRCHGDQFCPELTQSARTRIAEYVSDKYEVATDVTITDAGTITGSCFRRLVLDVAAPRRSLLLFLAPDGRFLSESLLDMNSSPKQERERVARATEADLLKDASPFDGPGNARVTVVVFSDFECPFCKSFSEHWYAIPAAERQDARIVFKHLPLNIHPWARKAALAGICAADQGNDAFWRLERFLFANQSVITKGNVDEKILEFASGGGTSDPGRMRACLVDPEPEKLLLRDRQLADLYHVSATPTVFINGVRKVGFASPDELLDPLRLAAAQQAPTGPRSQGRTGLAKP